MTNTVVGPRTAVDRLPLQPPVRVDPAATLADVSRAMRAADTGAVLVGDGSPSIATERDLVRALAHGLRTESPIRLVAVHDPVTVNAHATILEAAATMLDRGVRHLVVVDDEATVLGVVSIRAALAVLLHAADHGEWVIELREKLEVAPEIWLG